MAAYLLGFPGMLRVSSITLLKPLAIILVAASGRQTLLTRTPFAAAFGLCRQYIGFFYRFRGKSTPVGGPPQAAYFPKICDIDPAFAQFCPLLLLGKMRARSMLLHPRPLLFPSGFNPDTLCPYLMFLAGEGRLSVDIRLLKTHSLRIGGHTYFTAMGMVRDLTDYLGRRKVARCSLRYYRSSPRLTISAIRRFFRSVPPL